MRTVYRRIGCQANPRRAKRTAPCKYRRQRRAYGAAGKALRYTRVRYGRGDVLSQRYVEIFHWINLETLQLFAASLFAALDTDGRR